jgi:hypothetical protein
LKILLPGPKSAVDAEEIFSALVTLDLEKSNPFFFDKDYSIEPFILYYPGPTVSCFIPK